MKLFPGLLVILCLVSCTNRPNTTPDITEINGQWVDILSKFHVCGKTVDIWSIEMHLVQHNQIVTGNVKGFSQWAYKNPFYIGTFSGTFTSGTLKGSLDLLNSEDTFTLNLNAKAKNGHITGTLTSNALTTCNNKSKQKMSAKVSFITTNDSVTPDIAEPNNSRATAKTLSHEQKLKLSLNSQDVDWFKFEVKETSLVTLTFEALSIFEGYLDLRNAENQTIDELVYQRIDFNSQANILPLERQLNPGIYYAVLTGLADDNFEGKHKEKGTYSLSLQIETIPDLAFEPNDTPEQATRIESGFSEELFSGRGDIDIFTFTLSKPQYVFIELLTKPTFYVEAALLDTNLERVYRNEGGSKFNVPLNAGTYFISTQGGFQKYTLNFSSSPLPDDKYEPNNSVAQAKTITSLDTQLHIFEKDEDWFKIELSQPQLLTMSWKEYSPTGYPDIYNEQFQKISYHASPSGQYIYAALSLPKGSYYIQLSPDYVFESKGEIYTFKLGLGLLPDASYEPNNTFEEATPLSFKFNADNLFLSPEDEDWFKISLPQGGFISAQMSNNVGYTLYDNNLKALSQGNDDEKISILVEKGDYFLKILPSWEFAFSYSLSVDIVDDDTYAPNRSRVTAAPITLDFDERNLMIGERYEEFFSFTLLEKSTLSISFSDNDPDREIDLSGDIIKGRSYIYGLETDQDQSFTLEAGTYIIRIVSYAGYGKYRLSISATPF